jgi:uncharacterized protein YdeI (YjbR/CyaY-like superfamily)
MKFRARLIPSGNATAVEVPADVMATLGSEARPPIVVTINGTTWRTRIARMRGQVLIGISAAHREAAGITQGDEIEVDVVLDTAPREVEEPEDLKQALDASPSARTAFAKLAFGLKRKHVRDIESAKSDEVRARRIARLVETLGA